MANRKLRDEPGGKMDPMNRKPKPARGMKSSLSEGMGMPKKKRSMKG